jgi:hypothetical protein
MDSQAPRFNHVSIALFLQERCCIDKDLVCQSGTLIYVPTDDTVTEVAGSLIYQPEEEREVMDSSIRVGTVNREETREKDTRHHSQEEYAYDAGHDPVLSLFRPFYPIHSRTT